MSTTTTTDAIAAAARRKDQAEEDAALIAEVLAQAVVRGMPWMLGRDIARAVFPELAERNMEGAKRRVRAAAEVSLVIASAPGSHGYALRSAVPPEEEVAMCEAGISQAVKMFRKWRKARKAAKARMTAPLPLVDSHTASAMMNLERSTEGAH